MKKCQMHNKKKRQALLYCNAALFGCNWKLCLSFFGPSPWFQANGQLGESCSLSLQHLPQPLTLLQPGPQPIIHGAATWVPRAAGASLASCGMGAICFQCGSPVGIPACGAALTERLGEAAAAPLHAQCYWTHHGEQTLWTHPAGAWPSLVREPAAPGGKGHNIYH